MKAIQRACGPYDKLYRWDVLAHAYYRCKANRGAAGTDGQTFADIEAYGERRWLGELAKELQEQTYRADPVKRVWIPKPDGKQRPLGIPTIRDRVVQMAAVLVLDSTPPSVKIYEAGASPNPFAARYQEWRKSGTASPEAVRNVARMLAATAWGMWKNGSTYRPEWAGVAAAAMAATAGSK